MDLSTVKPQSSVLQLTPGVIALCVLAALCTILGAIYAYIYYTRIRPRSSRARKFTEGGGEDDGSGATHTHLFLFKK